VEGVDMTGATTSLPARSPVIERPLASKDRTTGPGRASYWLSAGLALAALSAGVTTFVAKDSIAGPAVSVGTARGTALVVVAVAVPLLLAAIWASSRGSLRAIVIWLGAAGYLLYNAVMFLFATPYNRFFLAYVAMLALALWSIGAVLVQTDVADLARHVTGHLPVRGIVIYAWTVSVLNALVWLRTIIPTMTADDPGSFLLGSGFITHPVYVQDLAVWIPLMIVSAAWLWRGLPWGFLLTASILTLWVVEAFGIATDQWFGSQADPSTEFASAAMSPAFLAWAAIGLVPLWLALRPLQREAHRTTEGIS
jgi:hypothetical protein